MRQQHKAEGQSAGVSGQVTTDLGGAAQEVGVEGEEHLERALRAHGLGALGQQRAAVHEPQARHQPAELRHHRRQAHRQWRQPARYETWSGVQGSLQYSIIKKMVVCPPGAGTPTVAPASTKIVFLQGSRLPYLVWQKAS